MKGALTAFDAADRRREVELGWRRPGYGSPIITKLGGTRQLVTITQGKVIGVDVATGALLWERPFVSANNTNGMTPVVNGQAVIVSGNGGPTVAFAVARRNNQWTTENIVGERRQPAALHEPGGRWQHPHRHVDAQLGAVPTAWT